MTESKNHSHEKPYICNPISYWLSTIQDSLLKDPEVNSKNSVSISDEEIDQGLINDKNSDEVKFLWKQTALGKRLTGHKDYNQNNNISVLVCPFIMEWATDKTRKGQAKSIPPFVIPALMQSSGELRPDPNHLPFIPRNLMAPQIGGMLNLSTPVSDIETYDATIRDMPINRGHDWSERVEHAKEMFQKVSGQSAKTWLPDKWQRLQPRIVVWEPDIGAARSLLPLLKEWSSAGATPGSLQVLNALIDGIGERLPAKDTPQFGHFGPRPLNQKQREAVQAVAGLAEMQIQAINGPPGTGKTSLLKTLLADTVVKAAVNNLPPPIVVLTSTNNQAVRNAAADLSVDTNDDTPLIRRRWMPGLPKLAAFAASQAGAAQSNGLMLFDETVRLIFSPGYVSDATPHFLACYAEWTGSTVDTADNATVAVAHGVLQHELTAVIQRIRTKSDQLRLAARYEIEGRHLEQSIELLETQAARLEEEAEELTRSAAEPDIKVKEILRTQEQAFQALQQRSALHPSWMRFLSILGPIEARRAALLQQSAVTLGYLPQDMSRALHQADVYHAVDAAFAASIAGLRVGIDKIRQAAAEKLVEAQTLRAQAQQHRQALQPMAEAHRAIEEWLAPSSGETMTTLLKLAEDALDTGDRALAFDLALRLREAEFLLRADDWDLSWSSAAVRSRRARPCFLEAIALLVPCLIATVYKAASHFTVFDGTREIPLQLPIDLLIFDEAGQVLPDHGVPLLGLARRAVAVGDVHQLEPIRSFSEIADDRLLEAAGLEAHETEKAGLSHSAGSVMRFFQRFTRYSDGTGGSAGVMLREHFRSVPQVIAYCNELVYRNRLQPVRPPLDKPIIPPMAWAHVRGDARPYGTSWFNMPEAEAIATWVASRKQQIEAHYRAPIRELVAVVTPYGYQQKFLSDALTRHLKDEAKGMTVGTVHTLQGAQRPIVIFSPTVTYACTGGDNPFFDKGGNMLNVAVSRAQDAFVVIGDMALFDEHATTQARPSTVLAKHLFNRPENELTDVIPGLAATISQENLQRINGLAPHQELLRRAFTEARSSLLISSPFLHANAIQADDILDQISQTVDRKVEVIIYTGMRVSWDRGDKKASTEQEKLKTAGARLIVTRKIHAKTLIVDDKLISEGSFNWLSASRNVKSANKETSFVLEGERAKAITAIARDEFAEAYKKTEKGK